MIAAPEALVMQAREQTGLSDFGPDGWQEGLDRLVAAVGVDVGADPAAVAAIESRIGGRLVNRLRIESWYEDQAAAAAAPPVEGPVVIVGLPRTATTALHHLLAVDRRFRYQRLWEVNDPVPPPKLATESEDPRRLAATGRPSVRHISTADGPTEDVIVLGLHFHNQELGLPVPTFTRWCRDADLASTFAYHERVLRLLHADRPPYRWLVKTPNFLFHLLQIADHYPDAKFLMTHRDPVLAFPSACSTILDAQRTAAPSYTPDPLVLGPHLLDHFVEGTRRAANARATLGEGRFCDVGQQGIDTDPLGTVERIYDFLGLDLRADVRAAMASWALDNRRGARGTHAYSAEEFGCTTDGIRRAFADYIEQFGPLVASHQS